jgi:hypothetical protein
MKNLPKIVALAFLVLALIGAALAEDSAHIVRANIPFNFYAGGQLLPAGEYTILVNLEDHVVTIGQKATGNRALLLGSPDDGSRDYRTVLTFKLVAGEVYALRELQGPDLGVSFNASGSKHAMRAQSQKSQSVEVIAEAK